MRAPLLFRLILLMLLCAGNGLVANATHILGGDITYSYISGSASRYHVVVRLYGRDPALGVPDQPQVELNLTRNGCSLTEPGSYSIVVARNQLTSRNLGCMGSESYRISSYEVDVTLVPGHWTITALEGNRTSGIQNLVNSGSQSYNLSASLDNSTGLTNSSPRFTSFTLPYVGGSQPFRYSFSTFEPDGDSLVYRSVAPKNAASAGSGVCGLDITYATYPAGQFQDPINGQTAMYSGGQYSTALPLPSFRAVNGVAVPQFDLNARNGDLLTTPVMRVGLYTVAVRVEEYRQVNGTWTQIGSVARDITYLVLNAGSNRNPSFTGLTVNGASTSQPIEQLISIQPGQLVSVTLTATDPDTGQTLQLSSDVADMIPGASFQALGTNQGILSWQVPATLPPGRYNFTATATDSNCPAAGRAVATITFVVAGQALGTRAPKTQVLAAYPVPFHDQVQFRLPTAAVQAVTITDNLGRVVSTLYSGPDGIVLWQPAPEVAPGAYFARPVAGSYVCRLLRQ